MEKKAGIRIDARQPKQPNYPSIPTHADGDTNQLRIIWRSIWAKCSKFVRSSFRIGVHHLPCALAHSKPCISLRNRPVIKHPEILHRFKQMLSRLNCLPAHQVFQFQQIITPKKPVEELKARKLRLIERAFTVTSSQVHVIELLLGKVLHSRSHQEQSKALLEPFQIVKWIIIKVNFKEK